jgi:anaerobic selenocysteine-containing dehydrogenase
MADEASMVKERIWEDKWIHTACGGCYGGCAIRVRRINGVAVAIEGIEDSSLGARGGICGKGAAGLMILYDPNRLNVPLKRTNPEKGIGVDPKWKEISWDEALDEIGEKLRQVMEDTGKKVWSNNSTAAVYAGWGTAVRDWTGCIGGGQRLSSGGSLHCGNAAHHSAGLVHGSWSSTADWRYADYVIKWGTNKGVGAGHSMTVNARIRSDMMARGAKEVSFDPMCNFSGGKATEWIPIMPGTDSAVALSMANIILNELGIYDGPFLKTKTNLAFLVKPDGRFARDRESNEPLVWDTEESRAKVHLDDSLGADNTALEGVYEVDGKDCRPAFILLKEHLKKYDPDWASEISTVPAKTIRRIATEFAKAARIGSTIVLEGKTFPYRPVACVYFRGSQGHTNGLHQVRALDLLNVIVGSADVPGGSLGWPSIRLGHPDTGHSDFIPRMGKDGVIIPDLFMGGHDPWPIKMPSRPCTGGRCDEFWPMSTTSGIPNVSDQRDVWEKLGMENLPEILFSWGGNVVASVANCEDQVKILSRIPYIVQIELFLNETSEALADIVLPDVCYLERLDWQANLRSFFFNHPPTHDEWSYRPQIPVVEPIDQRRNCLDIMTELADRAGFRDKWNENLNQIFKITDPEYQLKPDEKLTWKEMGDRVLKWCFGPDKGIDYFIEHGNINWPKKIEETYWRWHWESLQKVRIAIYYEHLIDMGEAVREIGNRVGLDLEWEQYDPYPEYFAPISQRELNDEFDLIAFSYRDILHTNSTTYENPWLDKASQMCPYTYTITLNVKTAIQKGLKDGDRICLETPYGRKETGVLKVLEGQHPQTVAIAGQAGMWAKRGRPIAKGKGSNFDKLLQSDIKHFDPLTLCIETAVPVKIYKIEGE